MILLDKQRKPGGSQPWPTVRTSTGRSSRSSARTAGRWAAIYARQKEAMSNFADYEKSAAPREIPVILLDPVA
jgi:hypothetical protein